MIGDALRLLRTFHGLKQGELAEELGLSKSYVSEMERNNREPSLTTLERYSEFFDIPVSSILFFSENLEDRSARARADRAVAKKILTILEFLAQKSGGATDAAEIST